MSPPMATTIINSTSVHPDASKLCLIAHMVGIGAMRRNQPNELSRQENSFAPKSSNWRVRRWRAIIHAQAPSHARRSFAMNAPLPVQGRQSARFVWDDPLLLSDQLTQEERMV